MANVFKIKGLIFPLSYCIKQRKEKYYYNNYNFGIK